jgi:AMP nucleosidase
MKSKEEIVENWLPRYTGRKLEDFGEYILLCNFHNYVQLFAEWHHVEVLGEGKPMQSASAGGGGLLDNMKINKLRRETDKVADKKEA